MKIKTIARNFDWVKEFDDLVNDAIEDGWQLARRDVLPAHSQGRRMLYAELVKLEPEPEPETVDPLDLLRQVKEFCRGVDACINCPLADWCQQLRKGGDPTDWDLPAPEVLTL
jgi:hypothetical protein